jgi:hypothetical protein
VRASRMAAFFVTFALVATASPALADTRDIEVVDLPFLACRAGQPDAAVPPAPGSGANDGAFPHICWVKFPQTGPWQASTGEWILFDQRAAFATEADCAAFAATATVTVTFQGGAVAFDTVPCQQPFPDAPFWVVAFHFLSDPLPPGTYSATLTLTPAGGSTTAFTQSVTVVPRASAR